MGAGHHSGALLLGVFQVSILHNIVHLLFGVAGRLLARTAAGARNLPRPSPRFAVRSVLLIRGRSRARRIAQRAPALRAGRVRHDRPGRLAARCAGPARAAALDPFGGTPCRASGMRGLWGRCQAGRSPGRLPQGRPTRARCTSSRSARTERACGSSSSTTRRGSWRRSGTGSLGRPQLRGPGVDHRGGRHRRGCPCPGQAQPDAAGLSPPWRRLVCVPARPAREVRVITAQVTITTSTERRSEVYRLFTTILDPDCPVAEIIALYHERWEIETSFLELKSTTLGGWVLRARTPDGVDQEIYALLVIYQALRTAIADTALARPDLDPDRGSFTVALHAARDQLISAAGVIADTVIDLAGAIGREVLAHLLPDRRLRSSPRVVKRAISKHSRPSPRTTPVPTRPATRRDRCGPEQGARTRLARPRPARHTPAPHRPLPALARPRPIPLPALSHWPLCSSRRPGQGWRLGP
jgi:hypothetical protein